MKVAGSRYDVGMIETFEQAREAVRAEMAPLVADPAALIVTNYGLEDRDGWFVQWGIAERVDGRTRVVSPLPRSATFVDRLTGFVSITAQEQARERIERMTGALA